MFTVIIDVNDHKRMYNNIIHTCNIVHLQGYQLQNSLAPNIECQRLSYAYVRVGAHEASQRFTGSGVLIWYMIKNFTHL